MGALLIRFRNFAIILRISIWGIKFQKMKVNISLRVFIRAVLALVAHSSQSGIIWRLQLKDTYRFFICQFPAAGHLEVDSGLDKLLSSLNPNKSRCFEGSFSYGGKGSVWHPTPFMFHEQLIQYQYNFMQLTIWSGL